MSDVTRPRLAAGDRFPVRVLDALAAVGAATEVPSGALRHVQLRRHAGCPICNLHLRSISRRLDEIQQAGIVEMVVFHSTLAELQDHQDALPFTTLADPERRLYGAVGVEPSLRAVLDPRFWRHIPRVVAQFARQIRQRGVRATPLAATGGELGRPADFLLRADGRIAAVHYGHHAADQWSVDELLAITRSLQSSQPS
jgi:hypothetical protein